MSGGDPSDPHLVFDRDKNKKGRNSSNCHKLEFITEKINTENTTRSTICCQTHICKCQYFPIVTLLGIVTRQVTRFPPRTLGKVIRAPKHMTLLYWVLRSEAESARNKLKQVHLPVTVSSDSSAEHFSAANTKPT